MGAEVAVNSEINTKHINTVISVIKTNQLCCMAAEVVFCSEINTKHTNTVWRESTIFEC